MSEVKKCGTSGAAWAGLILAIIALILVIIIYIVYFLERESFLKVFDPEWTVSLLDKTAKTIAGENYTLYVVPTDIAAGDTLTVNQPSGGSKPGQWFMITNLADKAVKVQAGSGVTFDSFPITTTEDGVVIPLTPPPFAINGGVVPPPLGSSADLPGKTSWIVTWLDSRGTAINVVPGGIKQS